jgi:hypothetical protein
MNKSVSSNLYSPENKLFGLNIRLSDGKTYHIPVYERNVRTHNGGVAYTFNVLERVGKNHHNIIFSNMVGSFSPCHACDGVNAKRHILMHLAMKQGDTDQEFFDTYSDEQLEFVNTFGEEIYFLAVSRYGEG